MPKKSIQNSKSIALCDITHTMARWRYFFLYKYKKYLEKNLLQCNTYLAHPLGLFLIIFFILFFFYELNWNATNHFIETTICIHNIRSGRFKIVCENVLVFYLDKKHFSNGRLSKLILFVELFWLISDISLNY